ncbi:class I SAM-dependent methyltransferase [Methanococcoides methylutens]|uniref:Putative methyltransferase n=1 Tax=Methanococcoides methylutens MM1 TaxID=1434104 RepID=A0A0E3SQA1_METMT|nr:class I SAM-dependent methyltransferase [Methanococcoides methylutens]AKB84786.1 putative methyltransferase [Methanococcoides methylutens MM1]
MDIEEVVRIHAKPSGEEGKKVGLEMNEHHFDLWKWGVGHISIEPASWILDVGCGGGRAVSILADLVEAGKVYGIDHSPEMVGLATELNRDAVVSEHVTIIHSSVSELPFPDGMFDIVTAFETCYFWPDIVEDLKEVRRVLKDGGMLLLVNEMYEHASFEDRNTPYSKVDGMNIFSPQDYRDMLESAGFSSVDIDEAPENNWITVIAVK